MRVTQCASVILINACCLLAAAQNSALHSDISSVLHRMNSERWTDREKALRQMPNLANMNKQDPMLADRLRVGLIQMLITENVEVKRSEALTEEHSDYYGDLVGAVSDLDDERAIPALVGAISTGGMATRALARFGDKALNSVLEELKNPDRLTRSSVLFTIRDLLEMHTPITPASRIHIKNALYSSLDDPEFIVRDSAVAAIEYLDDREQFVPALQKLAQSDPVKLPGKPDDGEDGGQFYPLRQDARRLLRKIANHDPPPIDRGVGP